MCVRHQVFFQMAQKKGPVCDGVAEAAAPVGVPLLTCRGKKATPAVVTNNALPQGLVESYPVLSLNRQV